jgi:hypothetical protein
MEVAFTAEEAARAVDLADRDGCVVVIDRICPLGTRFNTASIGRHARDAEKCSPGPEGFSIRAFEYPLELTR